MPNIDSGTEDSETEPDGRTLHYGEFYGVRPHSTDARPLVIVWGNCQAEAVRVLLDAVPGRQYRTLRVPPVHEIEKSDLEHVESVMARTRILLSQPVRSGYRGMPIGTDDVAHSMASDARVVRWPVVRYAGLHPFQVIVRHPGNPSAVPAAVPYHDLRTVVAAHQGRQREDPWDVDITADGIRSVAQSSVEELSMRERRDSDVGISDMLAGFGVGAAHTINHPGNDVLRALARRILTAMGFDGTVPQPDRLLLGSVVAPIEDRVLSALGLRGAVRTQWRVNGEEMSPDHVHRSQMEWYETHPEFVAAALNRHAKTLVQLGMST